MLQRIVDLCRSLAGKQPRTNADGQPVEDDRRVWVRYQTNVEATVLPVAGAVARLPARVRNVSRGGISLVVFHDFPPGDLVNIDLAGESPGSTDTILAYVIHVAPVSDGAWALGCVFAEELGDDELAVVGARRLRAPSTDNRSFVRFPCTVKATYQRVDDPDNRTLPVEVANISATGIGLVLDCPLAAGALLSLDLGSASGAATRTILACVVHVVTRPDDRWALGCSFIRELDEAELEALL